VSGKVLNICCKEQNYTYSTVKQFSIQPHPTYPHERYVGWSCVLNCFMLSSLPCFYAICWSAIPTSCYIFYFCDTNGAMYHNLCTTLDKYSIFCGRNPV